MATYTQTPVDEMSAGGDGTVSPTTLTFSEDRVVGSSAESGEGVSFTKRVHTGPDEIADVRVVGNATVEINRVTLGGVRVSEQRVGADGVIIPTGSFRDVKVWVEDSEGEPLTSATWIQSAGLFPTAARVEETQDGRAVARLWLLDASYQAFQVLAEGSESVGYVWYQTESGSDTPAIDDSDREATLRFNASEPASGANNLSVGYGASIGGT